MPIDTENPVALAGCAETSTERFPDTLSVRFWETSVLTPNWRRHNERATEAA